MSEEIPKKRGRPKKPKAKGRPKSAPVFDENGIELSKRQIQKRELDQKKLEAKLAYEARKEREREEAALTPIEKEALKLLREEERLKQAEIKANEQARKDTIRNEKVSMEMARIKAEETRQKIEEKPLSLSQLTKLFFKPCDTRADLKAWIKYFLGLDLPDYTTSRYADSNPLDIIWEIYRICVHKKNPENVEELLVVAGRGSGKTLSVAIAEFLLLFHDQRDVAHVGAILSQAKRCYEYQVGFLLSDKVKQILNQEINTKPMIEKMTQEKSLFNVKDRFTGETIRVGLEVLPCTLKAVNGAHVAFVSVDEIDTISGEGARALLDVSGMLDSKRGRKALRVGISTRKSRYGIMNRQIEEAEKAGRTVRKWTILEFSERCDDARSGRIPTDAYINQDTLEVLLPKEFEKLDKRKKGEFELNHFPGDRCVVCPLAALCRGDAKLQKSTSTMLKPISDAIKKTRENGPDWAISQLFNLKPSVEGVIFKEFDEKVHVQDWNGMWEILTGTSYPGVCTHDIFVKKCFSDDTEVMTESGFKLFQDLLPEDKIASLNDAGQLIYETPTDYISHHYKGEMVNVFNEIGGGGKKLDMLVTPDHQQTYLTSHFRKNNKIKILKTEVENLPVECYIPAAPLSIVDKLPMPIAFNMTGNTFFEILGLWLSEGSILEKTGISIGQYKSKTNCDKVNDLLLRSGIDFSFYRDERFPEGGKWEFRDKKLVSYLLETSGRYCHEKQIPRNVLENANTEQLKLVFDWMMFGDGSHIERSTPYYATTSKKMADDFQELSLRLGFRSIISVDENPIKLNRRVVYRVSVTVGRENLTGKCWHINRGNTIGEYGGRAIDHIARVPNYDGMVYCVTMPSGRLFTRRNNVISLSGNCHSMNLPSYAGVDFGWSSPAAYVVCFIDNRENVYVVRTEARTYTSNPNWIQTIKMKWHPIYKSQLYFPDCANPGDVQMFRQEGLPVPTNQIKDIPGGIQVIKKWLRSLASPTPKFYVAKETNAFLIEEFKLYHFKTDAAGVITDDPEDENNHACFLPGSLVHTIDGMVPIEQIQPGSLVLNRLGEYKPVVNVMSSPYQGEVTKVKFFGREEIIATPEHPFYIKTLDRSHGVVDGRKLSGQLRPIGLARYMPIGSLQVNKKHAQGEFRYSALMPKRIEEKDYTVDFLYYLNQYQPTTRASYTPHPTDPTKMVARNGRVRDRYYKVDEGFAFLIGYYLAEGNRSGSITQMNGISLAGHVKEKKVEDYIIKVMKKVDSTAKIKISNKPGTNGRSIKINSVKMCAFFLPCLKGINKKPHPFVATLPLYLKEYILAGYMFGDGCFTGGTARGCSISSHIAYEMFSILNDLGYQPNIKLSLRSKQAWANKPGITTVTKNQYKFSIQLNETNDLLAKWRKDPELALIFTDKKIEQAISSVPSFKGFTDEEGSWKNLKEMDKKDYTGMVYNLEMLGDPSYVVNGAAVHNCDALRYIMYGLFSKSRSVMSSSDSEFDIENVMTESGALKRAPSAVEFAAIHNIPINTEVFDPKSIGKMVRASEMAAQTEENEEGVGGSGSFLFSF
jgi:hypothetical protein